MRVRVRARVRVMLGEGTPRSTTRSPVLEAMIGPMVVPHGQSFLTWLGVSTIVPEGDPQCLKRLVKVRVRVRVRARG